MQYLRGVKLELKKVTWPKREDIVKDTGVVIAVCAVISGLFWAIDSGLLAGLKAVLSASL